MSSNLIRAERTSCWLEPGFLMLNVHMWLMEHREDTLTKRAQLLRLSGDDQASMAPVCWKGKLWLGIRQSLVWRPSQKAAAIGTEPPPGIRPSLWVP